MAKSIGGEKSWWQKVLVTNYHSGRKTSGESSSDEKSSGETSVTLVMVRSGRSGPFQFYVDRFASLLWTCCLIYLRCWPKGLENHRLGHEIIMVSLKSH